MIRVCPERDAVCPHGMECPWVKDRYSCHDDKLPPPALNTALAPGEDVGGVAKRDWLLDPRVDGMPNKYFSLLEEMEIAFLEKEEAQAAQIASLSAKVAEVERERDEAERLKCTWFETHIAHRDALNSLGRANGELLKRAMDAEARASELERENERLRKAASHIGPYLRWTISEESPGHHPTMPSAVAAFHVAFDMDTPEKRADAMRSRAALTGGSDHE